MCESLLSEWALEEAEEVLEDHRRLVRELDKIWNGDNAAPQASLCDLVSQINRELPLIRETLIKISRGGHTEGHTGNFWIDECPGCLAKRSLLMNGPCRGEIDHEDPRHIYHTVFNPSGCDKFFCLRRFDPINTHMGDET